MSAAEKTGTHTWAEQEAAIGNAKTTAAMLTAIGTSANQIAALAGANAPSASNVVATMADIPSVPVIPSQANMPTSDQKAALGGTSGTPSASNPYATKSTTDLKADLVGGTVPASQLPSYVDDVIEAANYAALPTTGETGKIYVTLDTNLQYRWSGTIYVPISVSLALGETSGTAYRGDRGKTAYDHSQITTGNPHGTTAAQVGAATAAQGALADTAVQPASTGIAGQVTFYNGEKIISGEDVFTWDSANNRLGVGTNTPLSAFHVVGNGVTATDPTSYTPTIQGRSQTVSVEGSNCSYFFSKAGSAEAAFGVSTNGNIFWGSISNTTTEWRVGNVVVVNATASGATFYGSSFSIAGSAPASATFGSNLLVSSWTAGTGWSGNNTTGWIHTTGNTATISGSDTFSSGKLYKISWVITNRTAGSITVSAAGISTTSITATGNTQQMSSSTSTLVVTPTSDFNGTVTFSVALINAYSAAFSLSSSNAYAGVDAPFDIRLSSSPGNLFIGGLSGCYNTEGLYLLGVGESALFHNTTGRYNSAVGKNALTNCTTGSYNMAFGFNAGGAVTTGVYNTFFGAQSGASLVTGSYNICIGTAAGYSNDGSSCVFIGSSAGNYQSGQSKLVIIDGLGNRGSAANELTNSLIVGHLDYSPSTQTISLNAVTTVYSILCQTTIQNTSVTLTNNSTRNQVVSNSGITFILPASPTIGLEFVIAVRGNGVTIDGGGKSLFYQSSSAVSSIVIPTNVSLIHLIFDGTYWVIA